MKILITGASSGIGQSLAIECLKQGHFVVGVARSFTKCKISDRNFLAVEFDLSDTESIESQLKFQLGNIDEFEAAVFCAGQGLFKTVEQFSFKEVEQLTHLNFVSSFMLTKLLLPSMKQQKRGSLIYIGSEAALAGKSFGSLYCATKFALRGFTQALRKECAKSQVGVSLINPGMVKTPFFDHLHFSHAAEENYYCLPEQIAELILLQLNSSSNFVVDEINVSPMKHQVVSKKKLST